MQAMANILLRFALLFCFTVFHRCQAKIPPLNRGRNTITSGNGIGSSDSADAFINGLLDEIIPPNPNDITSNQNIQETSANGNSLLSRQNTISTDPSSLSSQGTIDPSNPATDLLLQDPVLPGTITGVDIKRIDQLGRNSGNSDPTLSQSIDQTARGNPDNQQSIDDLFFLDNAVNNPVSTGNNPSSSVLPASPVPSDIPNTVDQGNPMSDLLAGDSTPSSNQNASTETNNLIGSHLQENVMQIKPVSSGNVGTQQRNEKVGSSDKLQNINDILSLPIDKADSTLNTMQTDTTHSPDGITIDNQILTQNPSEQTPRVNTNTGNFLQDFFLDTGNTRRNIYGRKIQPTYSQSSESTNFGVRTSSLENLLIGTLINNARRYQNRNNRVSHRDGFMNGNDISRFINSLYTDRQSNVGYQTIFPQLVNLLGLNSRGVGNKRQTSQQLSYSGILSSLPRERFWNRRRRRHRFPLRFRNFLFDD